MLTDDIRHAFHAWRRMPVLSATVILTVALGVGANTAVFSVVYAVIFRPLPYPAAERLVELFEQDQRGPFWRVSPPNYLSWTERSTSFDAIASFRDDAFNLTDDRNPERVSGARVTASLFRVLGLAPVRGRPLRVEDERPAAPRVALIAESLWRRRFGGDEGIVGQSITLNGERHQVIGVVPPAFREVGRTQISASAGAEIFVPLEIDPLRENRSNHVLRVVGRLRPGVSLDRAREEMRLVGTALEQEYPASNTAWGIRLERIQDSMFDTAVRPSLRVLLGAVGIVLLTACANIANLLLARASGRQRELVMRTILGAERPRLVKQLMTESLCLALVGGVCGLVAGVCRRRDAAHVAPCDTSPHRRGSRGRGRTDVRVIVSLISGVLFGALPAIHATRIPPLLALMQGGRGIATASRAGVRRLLLVTQMGLATMLLVAGALLLQSFMRLQHVPLGFEPGGVITARVSLPRNSPERVLAFYEQFVASLASRAAAPRREYRDERAVRHRRPTIVDRSRLRTSSVCRRRFRGRTHCQRRLLSCTRDSGERRLVVYQRPIADIAAGRDRQSEPRTSVVADRESRRSADRA
jgi:predicted permease